jgi:VIT1/CCC1 family predicted Fe2+/Mn2+ transporter
LAKAQRARFLDPLERFSELVFGLIMVLTFTTSLTPEAGKDQFKETLINALGCNIAWGFVDAVFYLIRSFAERARSQKPPHLSRLDYFGALAVFFLVVFATLPVVLPFIFVRDYWLALRISNAIAILFLFVCGFQLAKYSGMRPILSGLSLVVIGLLLVGITVFLGG